MKISLLHASYKSIQESKSVRDYRVSMAAHPDLIEQCLCIEFDVEEIRKGYSLTHAATKGENYDHLTKFITTPITSRVSAVSCAKSESCGMSMREALVCGKHVWAIESNGVKKLREDFGSKYANLLDLSKSDHKLASEFRLISNTLVPSDVSVAIRSRNRKYLRALFNSWVSLLVFSEVIGEIQDE